jgi:hypothetical protein
LRAAAALRYTQGEEAHMTVPDRVPFYEPFIEGTMVECMTDANNAACMEGGGYALGTGNSPATYVRLENFYAMHEEGFAHGRYGGAA